MSFEYSQELANDYEKLLETEEGCDIIIYAGENENVKAIHAHSNILCIRSKYFRTALSNEWAKEKGGKFILKKPNISPQHFKIILRFIYCGKIDLAKLQGPDVLKLLIAVDELNIQTLISCIQKYLIEHQDEFLQQNPIGILETVYQHETFVDLWNFCLEEICGEPEVLFNSDKFVSLKAPLLELLLKRDDLYLDEIVIWDGLIKWSLAQHPSIQQDVKKWNKDEITIMERTLHKFIPLIRFYHISSEDFLLKVYPFKVLLSEELVNNVLAFHMAPSKKPNIIVQSPRQLNVNSILIKSQHFAVFASWIEKKNDSHYNVRNLPYRFDLIYRASRDGNTTAAFREKCDNKEATIVIAKIKDSEKIVGGYNPLQWRWNGYGGTDDSFIFSFTNSGSLQSAKVCYPSNNSYSVYCHESHGGPAFGGGWDLIRKNEGIWYGNNPHSYPKLDGIPKGNFNVDDYEVFQVVKN